jgi:hypothetical protein
MDSFGAITGGQTMRVDVGHGVTFLIKRKVTWGEKASIADLIYATNIKEKENDAKIAGNLIRMRGDVCKKIVVGWEGVNDKDGQAIVWKPEFVEQLTDDVTETIINAYAEAQNEDKKKAATTGAGNSPSTDGQEPPAPADTPAA